MTLARKCVLVLFFFVGPLTTGVVVQTVWLAAVLALVWWGIGTLIWKPWREVPS